MKSKKELTEGFARNDEEKVFLASLLDKNEMAQDRGIPSFSKFCTQEQQVIAKRMLDAVIKTSDFYAEKHNLDVIPNGEAVEAARDLPEFQGELNINRDGFHLSYNYGRYLAGLTMFGFFTGKDATLVTYEPEDTDPEINAKLKKIASDLTLGK